GSPGSAVENETRWRASTRAHADLTNCTRCVITRANALTGDALMSRSPSFAQLGRGLFLSFVLVTFAAPAASSQTSTGSIRGYVKAASGAPLGAAAIDSRNEQSGASRTTNSQHDGPA